MIHAIDVKLNIPDDDYSNKNQVSRLGTDDEIAEGGFISLHLHPTVQLSNIHNNNEKRRLDLLNDFEEQEYKHAIYAPLHHFLSTDDDDVENNAARIMEEFEQYRQISRFERNYQSQHKKEHERRKLQIDKQQQTVPLFQGYGTHYSTVWVGSPQAQRKTVIVDTGSHYTAFPCVGCDNCGEEHHTDKLFDPSLSQSFRKLECHECKDNAMCSMMEGQGQGLPPNDRACIFRQSYTEGSSWTAYQAIDSFYCGTAHGNDDDQNQKQGIISEKKNNVYNQNFAIPFMFGCQISETGLFVTQLADGIMGMSKNDNTLIKHMYDAGVVPKKQFSLCFKREAQVSKDGILAGIFTLGGSDPRLRQQTTQQNSKSEISRKKMRFAKNISDTGWYTVNIRNIFLRKGGGISTSMNNFEEGAATTNNQPIIKLPIENSNLSGGKGVIIDSGTTDTYFPQALRADFHKIWHDTTGLNYSNRALKLSREQVEKLPTLLIQMEAYYDSQNNSNNNDPGVQSFDDGLAGHLDFVNPKDILIAVPAIHYMEYSPSKKTYTSRLYFTETSGGVIGANAMQGHDVLFDWEQPRIGFVESSCNYEELDFSSIANDVADPLPNDGEPPLTKEVTTTQTKNENDSREKCVLSQPQRGDEGCEDIVKKIFERYCTESRPGSFMLDMVDETYIFEILESERSTNISNKCEDAAKEVIPEASSVNCDTKQCVIKKKCQISCDDVWDMSADTQRPVVQDHDQNHLGNLATNETPKNTNCQEPWSLCSARCTQTKSIKVQKEDGSCELVDNSVRPCHIDACHGSCIVPYVLHVVVGLTNIDPSHWTKPAEEAFVESFVSPLPRIEPGDVDVVFVNVLKNGETEEMGLKLVLEISVFSQKAENANSSSSSSPCSYSDPNELHSLARIASGIHQQIQSESYVTNVLQKMPLTQYVTSSNTITTIQNSKVLSSITVDAANGNNHDHSKDEQLLSLNNNKNSQYIQNGISQMNSPNETVVMDKSSSSNYFLSTGQSVGFMIFTAFALASYFRHRRRVAQSTNIISPRRRIRQRSRGKYSKVTINDSGDIEMA